jgi:hypothetical protein
VTAKQPIVAARRTCQLLMYLPLLIGTLWLATGCRDDPPRRTVAANLCDRLVQRWMQCLNDIAPNAQQSQLDGLRDKLSDACELRGEQLRWGERTMKQAAARRCLVEDSCPSYAACLERLGALTGSATVAAP